MWDTHGDIHGSSTVRKDCRPIGADLCLQDGLSDQVSHCPSLSVEGDQSFAHMQSTCACTDVDIFGRERRDTGNSGCLWKGKLAVGGMGVLFPVYPICAAGLRMYEFNASLNVAVLECHRGEGDIT